MRLVRRHTYSAADSYDLLLVPGALSKSWYHREGGRLQEKPRYRHPCSPGVLKQTIASLFAVERRTVRNILSVYDKERVEGVRNYKVGHQGDSAGVAQLEESLSEI
jgi:hypothetical protein